MQGVDITWDVIPSLPKIIFTKNVNHSWKLNILDRSFSLFFSADKLKALGVAEHFPFCVKVPEEATENLKGPKNEIVLLYSTRVRLKGIKREVHSPQKVIWIGECLLVESGIQL